MSKKQHDLVAVPEEGDTVGAIAWWSLTGVESLRAVADAVMQQDDLFMPTLPTDAVALHRALVKLYAAKDVRNLHSGTFAVISSSVSRPEGAKLRTVDFDTRFRVGLGKEDTERLVFEGEDLPQKTMDDVTVEFMAARKLFGSDELAKWLLDLLRMEKAVALRPSGGVYFVPSGGVAKMKQAQQVVDQVRMGALYMVPALRTTEAVTALLASLVAEVTARVEHIGAELDDVSNPLSKRELETRRLKCDEMLKKISVYEGTLGQTLADLTETVSSLQVRAAQARLSA